MSNAGRVMGITVSVVLKIYRIYPLPNNLALDLVTVPNKSATVLTAKQSTG